MKTIFLARRLRKHNNPEGIAPSSSRLPHNNPEGIAPPSPALPANNPEGIASFSPGLRGTSYPGIEVSKIHNPERVASDPRRPSVEQSQPPQMIGLLLPPS